MRDIIDYQHKYKNEPGEERQVRLRRKHVLDIMSRYAHNNILEVGCGLQPLFCFMDDYKTTTIVEPGSIFVENAIRLKEEKQNKCINIIEGFCEDCIDTLKQIQSHYDYIVVSSLLHELENPDVLMEALRSLSDENTVIHINVTNANSVHRLIAKKMGLISDVYQLSDQQITMQRKKVYDIETLEKYVSGFGFSVIEKGSFFPKFLTGEQMDSMVGQKIVGEEYFDALDELAYLFEGMGSEIYVQIKK